VIVTGQDLEAARKRLGWSVYQMGEALRLKGDRDYRGQFVREMESGRRPVSGPVAVAVEGFLAGHRPEAFHG
jgi:hypothetical protein